MKKILSALIQPYPYYNHTQKLPKLSLAVFLLVFLFLFLFSPFSVNGTEHKYSYVIICIMHAANAAAIFFLFFLIVNNFFASLLKEENWKVYKTILLTSVLFILIGAGSYFIRPIIYNNPHNASWHYFFKETFNTFLVGSLLFTGFTLVDMFRLLNNNQAGASEIEEEIEKHHVGNEENQLVNINVENEYYQLNLTEFLFAKAEGNYSTCYFNRNNNTVKELKRSTLKSLEEQLATLAPAVIRTHRTFLVNTKHIIKMTGNAQGYQLYFQNIDFTVPVSRAMIPTFKRAIQQN